jgi:tripartite-type tricarboxylate transporter receptor subunit TctC
VNKRFSSLALAAVLATMASISVAQGQGWPKGAVRIVVPFDAGSTPDSIARIVSSRLSARLGQPMVVDNKSGAGGNIGTDAIAKAAPDGQTIGVSIAGPLAVNSLLYKKMPYNPAVDLEPVTVAVSQASVLVVSAKHASASVRDFAAMLKGGKEKMSFASIGAGSISHLAMQTVAAQIGADFVHIPYRGSGAAVTALLSSEIDMALLPAAAVMPHIKSGKIRGLAVASAKRSLSLPDLPTFAESGLPDIQADAWIGFIVPAKTPVAIVTQLHDQIVQILAEPAIKEKLHAQYMDPVGNSPAEFRALLAADVARWKPIIQTNKISLD